MERSRIQDDAIGRRRWTGRPQVWGIAALGGIGFTVSLFIARLAYDDAQVVDGAKVGIFAGSLGSAAIGAVILLRARPQR